MLLLAEDDRHMQTRRPEMKLESSDYQEIFHKHSTQYTYIACISEAVEFGAMPPNAGAGAHYIRSICPMHRRHHLN